MLKRVIALVGGSLILYNLFQHHTDQPMMADKNEKSAAVGHAGSAEMMVLLSEYLSTSSYILRNLKTQQLNPGECVPILEHLQHDLASTVTSLRDSLAGSLSTDDGTRATTYLTKVDGVLLEMPTILSIMKKYPKGNAELEKFIPNILEEFTRLTTNLGSVFGKHIAGDIHSPELKNKI